MESIDFFDRWLDPPDLPAHWPCDGCGESFDDADLTLVGGPGSYRYLCADCEETEARLKDSFEYEDDEE